MVDGGLTVLDQFSDSGLAVQCIESVLKFRDKLLKIHTMCDQIALYQNILKEFGGFADNVKNIKTYKINLLDITMLAIMKIKSYYSDQEDEDILLFEPNEEYYEAYRHFIKPDN